MKNKATLIAVIVLAVAAVVLGGIIMSRQFNVTNSINTEDANTDSDDSKKPSAPDFTVYDKNGNAYSLSDFHGEPVVLNFWASWCGPCKNEMPDFDEVCKAYGENVNFIMVNLTDGKSETVASASEFIAKSGYTFPVYYDIDMSTSSAYGISSIPTTFFIDSDGVVVAYYRGMMSKEMLLSEIAMIYSE